jgi:uncharacterized protein YoxC
METSTFYLWTTFFLGLTTLGMVIAAVVFILIVSEVKKTAKTLKEFTDDLEPSLRGTLSEIQHTLRSVRDMTENVAGITEDFRRFSSAVREIGENVREVSAAVENLSTMATVRVSGIKAGMRAAMETLLTHMRR